MTIKDFLNIPSRIYNFFRFRIYPTEVAKGAKIYGRVYRRGRGKVYIGENTKINSSKSSNALGGSDYTTLFAMKGAQIRIGANSGISNATLIARQSITVGDRVKIGADCKIYDNDFHAISAQDRASGVNDIPLCKPIVIGDDVFIGAHSLILKGVKIGNKSVIGGGSVVTKDVPENEIWAGNPAKFIRKIDDTE